VRGVNPNHSDEFILYVVEVADEIVINDVATFPRVIKSPRAGTAPERGSPSKSLQESYKKGKAKKVSNLSSMPRKCGFSEFRGNHRLHLKDLDLCFL
jgi:hypothetical protein